MNQNPKSGKTYPILSGKFKWHDKDAGTVVCPISLYDGREDLEKTLWQLECLGFEILGEIDMPMDLDVRFFHCKLPANFHYDDSDDGTMDETDYIQDFMDEQDRIRFRIIHQSNIMMNTKVFTRFYPTDYDRKFRDVVPCVVDVAIPDEDNEDRPTVIWKGPTNRPKAGVRDILDEARKWLETNKPGWEDPTKYWDEAGGK